MRTFLVEMHITDPLINALRIHYEGLPDDLKYDEILLKSVVLGAIANLVVEFSALKKEIANRDLVTLLEDIIDNSSYDILRANALHVIKNSLYKEGNKQLIELFSEVVPLEKCFDLCDYPYPEIQEQSINILRNFSVIDCSSSTKIWTAFSAYSKEKKLKETNFFAFLLRHLNNTKAPSMIETICYIISHFAASTLDNKILVMCHEDVLLKLLEILKSKIPPNATERENYALWKVKLSIIWVVINLTWKEETVGVDNGNNNNDINQEFDEKLDLMDVDNGINPDFESFSNPKNRALKLIDLGFYDVLKNIGSICNIQDIKERSRTAIFQLVLYGSNISN
ncbi:unnamed protein product [Ambrosiozyma monospora]|uniref:Unnamed protein product n=1 Tax=Ambrosiozyma monospora TaxID=43982 RepID=A0ACB5TL06_AMBMO|nr:unnamed protein product [Ambrosiozyma monospora]